MWWFGFWTCGFYAIVPNLVAGCSGFGRFGGRDCLWLLDFCAVGVRFGCGLISFGF